MQMKLSASADGRTAANDNVRQGWRHTKPARDGDGLEIPSGYYRSIKFLGMVFRRRQIDGGVPAEAGSHVNAAADRHMAGIKSGAFQCARYSDSALRTARNKSVFAVSCRGATRYARDEAGKLIPDDADETGFQTIPKPSDRPFAKSTTPEEREAGRERAAIKAEAERKAIAKMRRKFEKRQRIGDPNCRLSENEDFPLLAVLRRDRRQDLIVAALEYRQLVALCESEPLKGQSYEAANGMGVERRSFLDDGVAEVNTSAAEGFEGKKVVPGGEIKYRAEIKRSKGAYDIPAKQALAVAANDGDPIVGRTQNLHTKLTVDTLADYIDKKPVLAKIRVALGGLRDPLEDAVLGGRTMQEIGADEGFSGSTAASAGKALVYRGLVILEGFLGMKKHKPANDNYLIEKRHIA